MHKRFSESVKNALIEIGVLSRKFECDVLPALFGNISDNTWETPEELLDRHHTYFQNAFVKLIEDPGLKRHGVGKFCTQGIAGVLLVEFSKRAIEHGLSDDQFADEIHNGINASGVHAKRAFGHRSSGRTGGSGFRCSAAFSGLWSAGD